MDPKLALVHDGKKFMWDGRTYESREDAAVAVAGYESDRFQVHLVEQDGAFLVYTRRVVAGDAVAPR